MTQIDVDAGFENGRGGEMDQFTECLYAYLMSFSVGKG
jgi:hypothetical protein